MHLTATFRAPEDNPFIVDIVRDIRLLNDQALKAKKSGMVILGGGQVLDFYLLVALVDACEYLDSTNQLTRHGNEALLLYLIYYFLVSAA